VQEWPKTLLATDVQNRNIYINTHDTYISTIIYKSVLLLGFQLYQLFPDDTASATDAI